jgi:hypothetical protein
VAGGGGENARPFSRVAAMRKERPAFAIFMVRFDRCGVSVWSSI